MIKFLGCSSEHKYFNYKDPKQDLQSIIDEIPLTERNSSNLYKKYPGLHVCTYGWFICDEFEEQFALAVCQSKPDNVKDFKYVYAEPIWNWIKRSRSEELQLFIEEHLDEFEECFCVE